MMTRAPLVHRLLCLLIALIAALAVLHPTPARAQSCTQEPCVGDPDPNDNAPPMITLVPGAGVYTQPTLPVRIDVSDRALADSTLQITWNGARVDSGFVYGRTQSSTLQKGSASGSLTMAAGTNTLSVRMCDVSQNCNTQSAAYAFGTPGVQVTPDGGVVQVYSGAAAAPFTFTVRNTGRAMATYTLTASCRDGWSGDPVTACTASASTVTVDTGAAAVVSVSIAGTTPGQVLLARLSAQSTISAATSDAGWLDVEVRGVPGQTVGAPQVSVAAANPGTQVDRSQCITVGAGQGAAMECGDLRLVHGLPAILTRGKARAPTLLYNSEHAHPRPIIYADVTLPAGYGVPAEVRATLVINGVAETRSWGGNYWSAGTTRRVGIQVDGINMATGVHPYTLQISTVYGSSQYPASAYSGELTVVNRKDSPFGPGWWLAGQEELIAVDYRWLVVGGDGSTKLYEWTSPGVWVAPGMSRPDSLLAWGSAQGSYYRRPLAGGSVVWFDPALRHAATINRLQDETRFWYNASSRLDSLQVPRRDGVSTSFRFGYAGTPERVSSVELRTAGTLLQVDTLEYTGGRLTAVSDPDRVRTRFIYGDANTPNRVTGRTDRRGTTVTYAYGAAGKLIAVTQPLNATETAVTNLDPGEGKGITAPTSAAAGYTQINGPRGSEPGLDGVSREVRDVTQIWRNRWGAPTRIRDGLGRETLIWRENAAFPALVTRTLSPAGLLSVAAYDAAGRVDSTAVVNPLGNGQNTITRYTYDNRWNAPTSVLSYTVAPGASVRTALAGIDSTAYDAANGNVLWQQKGDASRRVTFDYHTSGPGIGLLNHVYYPAPQPGVSGGSEEVAYDSAGNLYTSRSPLGFYTVHVRDGLGRDTLVVTPIRADSATTVPGVMGSGARSRTVYDSFGRVKRTEAIGPAVMPHVNLQSTYTGPGIKPAEHLFVENVYGTGGELLEVKRWSSPDSAGVGTLQNTYTYDRAGRKLTENDGSGPAQEFEYDRAGNVTAWVTQRGSRILSEYDALGRLVKRIVPEASYARQCPPGAGTCPLYRFPFYSTNPAGGYTIPAEVFVYRYDAAGNQVWAENLDARVARSFYPGGALRTDTIQMRSYDGLDYSQHVYGIEYAYDMAGRVTSLQHPGNLAAAGSRTDSYAYHPVTGALAQVTGRQGHVFQYGYDEQGRMIWQTYPSGIERSVYDVGGQRIFRVDSTAVEGELSRETHDYDARGKLLHSYTEFDGDASHSDNWYSGLGNLVATNWNNVGNNAANIERFTVDAMGNQFRRSTMQNATPVPYQTQYAIKTGRVLRIDRLPSENPAEPFLPDSTLRSYDLSGNVEWARNVTYSSVSQTSSVSATWNLYGADEKLRVLQTESRSPVGTAGLATRGLFSEYRYDALGRRILERTRRDSVCNGTGVGECASTVTRFIWSGDQLLWELRANGSNGQSQELADGTGGQYGRVGYLHAGGIDRPLLITKGGTSVIPHDNWRGTFATGTLANGQRAECHDTVVTNCLWIVWPGWKTTASHAAETAPSGQSDWWGGLVDGMRDASGRMYMRNRYYDPTTAQFTQTDPIGLAGGLNSYGFAAGDPVSYDDPFGLKVEFESRAARRLWGELQRLVLAARNSRSSEERGAAFQLGLVIQGIERSENTMHLDVGHQSGLRGRKVRNQYGGAMTDMPWRGWFNDDARVFIDPARVGQLWHVSALVALGHELGHAHAILYGLTDKRSPAITTDNATRILVGCYPGRTSEQQIPPACPNTGR